MNQYICTVICVGIIAFVGIFASSILCLTWLCSDYKDYFIQELSKKNSKKKTNRVTWFKNVNEDSRRQENTKED